MGIPRWSCSSPSVLPVSTAAARNLATTGLGFRKQEAARWQTKYLQISTISSQEGEEPITGISGFLKRNTHSLLLVSVRQSSFECLHVSFYWQSTPHMPKRHLQHLAVISGLARTYSQTTGVHKTRSVYFVS